MRLTPKMLHALRSIVKGGYWEDRATEEIRHMALPGPCSFHGSTIQALRRHGLIEGVPGSWELQATEKGKKVLEENR